MSQRLGQSACVAGEIYTEPRMRRVRHEGLRCVHVLPETAAAGTENQVLDLLRELARRDHVEPELVCFAPGRNHARFLELGIPVHEIGRRRRLALDAPRRVRALRRRYAERAPDILHTWLFEATAVGLWAARSWPAAKVVVAQRSGTGERDFRAQMAVTRALLPRADYAISNSREGADLLGELGMSADRIAVLGQGVNPARVADVTRAPEVRRRLELEAGCPLVVAVGRPHADKDFGGLVQAMQIVWRDRADTRLVIVGATAKELAAIGVELPAAAIGAGWQERPSEYIAAADAVVIPSWTEGHSNVADEALLLGRPVVTTDTGSHPALVAEAGGRVVPIRRPDLLAGAILDVLTDPPDPAAVASVAERELSIEKLADQTLAIYAELLDGQAPR
jgi:glycosyltransferase involved in cell wall biosynthesis